jgi:hypothetical protein
LRGYDGTTFEPMGCVRAATVYNGRKEEMDFYVIKDGGPNLVGLDWLKKFEVRIEMFSVIFHDH